MIYEIRVREWMGTGSSSLGYFYKYESNAQIKCDELNEMLTGMGNVYFVQEVILQDDDT